jgi:uroporphyrinogen decarboxylase
MKKSFATPRENLLSLYRRQGYQTAPVTMNMCPSLVEEFQKRHGHKDYLEGFGAPLRVLNDPGFSWNFEEAWRIPNRPVDWSRFYPGGFQHPVKFDGWGIAHESYPDTKHMTRMHHPLCNAETVEDLKAYPWPDFDNLDFSYLKPQVEAIQKRGLAALLTAECTIWEIAWYLRSMEVVFCDMAMENDIAFYLFDKITDMACLRARKFAEAGVDILALGDDIGMQSTPMMSNEMYRQWIKPRLAKVIATAKAVNPDIIIMYHSCGYVRPFIGDLIEAGIDVLNPVQPECMDFAGIHAEFGDRLSFNGTLGTQTLFPFGTPEQIRAEVFRNLDIAGDKGGLFCCPTHMLEPEVPWENVLAYVDACREYSATH